MDDHRRHHDRPWQVTGWWWVPLAIVAALVAIALGPIIAEAS